MLARRGMLEAALAASPEQRTRKLLKPLRDYYLDFLDADAMRLRDARNARVDEFEAVKARAKVTLIAEEKKDQEPFAHILIRGQYDKPGEEAILDEQAQCLPHGPLGLLKPPEVKVTDGLSEATINLVREYEAGGIGSFELAQRLESLKRKTSSKFVVQP